MASPPTMRIYVGGLPEEVRAQELHKRFGGFVSKSSNCLLTHVELPKSKFPQPPVASSGTCRGFAYLTLKGADAATQSELLQKTFNRTKWRGNMLKVQVAKPHYKLKLEQEWQERELERKQREDKTREWQTHIKTPNEQVKPLQLAVAFQGRKKTDFVDVNEGDEEAEEDAKTTTDTEDSEEEENEAAFKSEDEESEGEALDEDDVEAFVRQVEEEAVERKQDEEEGKALSKEQMNARRLAALEAKQKQKEKEKAKAKMIISASSDAVVRNKKITFDDSGNEQDPEEQEKQDDPEVITNWMESSDDEEADGDANERTAHKTFDFTDTDDADAKADADAAAAAADAEAQAAFAVRPEFVGAQGKKLFEMQKRFGGDTRFRLNAHFLEDEMTEFGGNDVDDHDDHEADHVVAGLQKFIEEEDPEEAARHAQELHNEEETALRVLATLFPDMDVTRLQRRMHQKRESKDPFKEAAWMGQLKRYDPRDVHSRREFEMPMTVATTPKDEAKSSASTQLKSSKEIPTGGDRFFSTSSNLSNLFSRVRANSEDGEEGEAALDGVFGLRAQTNETESSACFKLSSLFSFPAGNDKPLAAMADELLEDEHEHDVAPPAQDWTYPQGTHDHHEDEVVTTDSEAGDEMEEDPTQKEVTTKHGKKKSLEDFLRFGRTFVGSGGDMMDDKWPERRKKLTLDYKRKRRDALKIKKRQTKQQHKLDKTNTTDTSTPGTPASSKWKKAKL